MRAKRETPEPWATWLTDARLIEPRARGERPSLRRLAERIDVHPSTVSAMVHGDRYTSEDIIEATAQALGVDVVAVSQVAKRARTVREPYRPPDAVHTLSRDVQDAISALILALAREQHGHAAATKRAGESPADFSSRRARALTEPHPESTPTPPVETPRQDQP